MANILNVVTPNNLSDEDFDKGVETSLKIKVKQRFTISNLKTALSVPKLVFITDANKEGWFLLDSSDTTSVGDDLNIIVTSAGKRYKKKSVLNTEYIGILNRLVDLEYSPQEVISFTNNVNNVEKGNTITTITFNYTFNKAPLTSVINNGIGSVTGNSQTANVNLTTDTTFTLTATDNRISVNKTSSVSFINKLYFGTSPNTSLDNSQVLGLQNNLLDTNKNRTITVNGEGQYIYYIYPASLGDSTFTINGLVSSAWTKTVVNVTNAFGNITSYNMYKTNTVQNGTGINITIS